MIAVSTKTGDKGETSLASGQRLTKTNIIFAAVGDLDELNSWLGLLAVKFGSEFKQYRDQLYVIQDTLFYLGAELAASPTTKLDEKMLAKLEKQSDQLQKLMAQDWHTKFLLPGGTELGAYLDIARTVCRRAERSVVTLSVKSPVRPVVLQYLNRLSDYLYILRCFVNHALEYQEKMFNTDTS